MNETETNITRSSEPILFRYIKLCLFASVTLPSVSVSIYILYKFFRFRQFRSRINNHSIIALVIVSFIDTATELPITLQYLRIGHVQPHTYRFCLFWIWYNFSLQSTNLSLMTWTSIERHILIFHSNWIQTSTGKLKYHYIPLIICVTYTPIFYFSCIIIYQCENSFNHSLALCGSICYNNVTWLSSLDWITNVLFPSLLIPLASIGLLFRVLIQAKRMRRTLKWRSTKKMTMQLMIISILYFIFWFPLAVVSLIRIYFNPRFITEITYYYLQYTPYLVQLLMPFVCIACLPEMWPNNKRAERTLTTQN